MERGRRSTSSCAECSEPAEPTSLRQNGAFSRPNPLWHKLSVRSAMGDTTRECDGCDDATVPSRRRGLDSQLPSLVSDVVGSPGRELPREQRARLGHAFGHDLSNVRLHTSSRAAESASAVHARAYTVGSHVVLGAGETVNSDGGRLLAHELAHVVQSANARATRPGISDTGEPSEHDADAMARMAVQGQPVRPRATWTAVPALQRQARRTAESGPDLAVHPSMHGDPCACIVFIHNNERNARLTAQLLHRYCDYNLAITTPDNRQRNVSLPAHTRHVDPVDPNELFPRAIAEDCFVDPQPCIDFLDANRHSTNRAVIEEYAQRRFFLAVRECSNGFTLPVVALHNNTIDDTARYRSSLPSVATGDVQGGTFDESPGDEEIARPMDELRDWLREQLDAETRSQMVNTPGKTNIFRWCVSDDIGRCHIGDPEHPDTLVWVTNEADFERLEAAGGINVALQSEASATGESATDLSTLFLILTELTEGRFAAMLEKLSEEMSSELGAIHEAFQGDSDPLGDLQDLIQRALRLLLLLLAQLGLGEARALRLSQLRYINIETPGSPLPGRTTEQQREDSYDAIAAVLAGLGLHCCPDTADANIRAGLQSGDVPPVPSEATPDE